MGHIFAKTKAPKPPFSDFFKPPNPPFPHFPSPQTFINLFVLFRPTTLSLELSYLPIGPPVHETDQPWKPSCHNLFSSRVFHGSCVTNLIVVWDVGLLKYYLNGPFVASSAGSSTSEQLLAIFTTISTPPLAIAIAIAVAVIIATIVFTVQYRDWSVHTGESDNMAIWQQQRLAANAAFVKEK